MSTRQLAHELGLTKNQIFYLISQGVIEPAPVGRGKKQEFTEHERWILSMAAAMRKAGIGISAIKATALTHRTMLPKDTSLVVSGGDEYGKNSFFTAYWNGKVWRATKNVEEALALMHEAGLQVTAKME